MNRLTALFALGLLLLNAALLRANNVDLSTVPDRDTVQLTIYNSEDLTLVRETRKVTFKQGLNPLQFSWANTLIDPSSVELRFLANPDKLVVLDTTYPHDKPQMLYWNVQSEFNGEAVIEITYFTSGISWSADYELIADPGETVLAVESFVRVHNRSGEPYENAQVRLVVGTINLVEKIAQLAQMPIGQVQEMLRKDEGRRELNALKMRAARMPMAAPAAAMEMADAAAPKQIIKEGLSEYFIYTIEGTETVPNGWSKRMRSFKADKVPFRIQYRYRPEEYGEQLVRMYLLTNNEASGLGTTPLPDGTVRLFRDNGRNGLSYLTQQHIKYIPVGDKIELNLGQDPSVQFERVQLKSWRDEIWVQLRQGNAFQRVDDGNIQIDVQANVVGWDEHALFSQRVRNYTAKAIELEVRHSFHGHTVFRSGLGAVRHDFRTAQFTAAIDPGQKRDLYFEVITKNGRNAKQNEMVIEEAAVQP